jgi:hypothetical protein
MVVLMAELLVEHLAGWLVKPAAGQKVVPRAMPRAVLLAFRLAVPLVALQNGGTKNDKKKNKQINNNSLKSKNKVWKDAHERVDR